MDYLPTPKPADALFTWEEFLGLISLWRDPAVDRAIKQAAARDLFKDTLNQSELGAALWYEDLHLQSDAHVRAAYDISVAVFLCEEDRKAAHERYRALFKR